MTVDNSSGLPLYGLDPGQTCSDFSEDIRPASEEFLFLFENPLSEATFSFIPAFINLKAQDC